MVSLFSCSVWPIQQISLFANLVVMEHFETLQMKILMVPHFYPLYVHVASSHFAKLTAGVCVKVGGADVACSQTVRNLGVVFDRSIKMDSHIHVQSLCQSAYFHLRNIRTLKPYLTPAACHHNCHACVHQFTNRLLQFTPSEQSILKLQHIQNCAARVIMNTLQSTIT